MSVFRHCEVSNYKPSIYRVFDAHFGCSSFGVIRRGGILASLLRGFMMSTKLLLLPVTTLAFLRIHFSFGIIDFARVSETMF